MLIDRKFFSLPTLRVKWLLFQMIARERCMRMESESINGIEVKWESTTYDLYHAKPFLDIAERKEITPIYES